MVISLQRPLAPALLPDGNYDEPALSAFHKALSAYERTLRAKLLAGYFVSTPPDDSAPGQVIYDGGFKHGVLVFDLHPKQLVAVVAQVFDSARVVIGLVDLTTNARETLDELTSESFAEAHWLRFEASGEHVRFAVNGDTWRLHIPTRTKERLATTDFTQSRPINPLSNRMIVDASNRSRTRFVELGDEQLTVREQAPRRPSDRAAARALRLRPPINPAKAYGIDKFVGSVQYGKYADLLVIAKPTSGADLSGTHRCQAAGRPACHDLGDPLYG